MATGFVLGLAVASIVLGSRMVIQAIVAFERNVMLKRTAMSAVVRKGSGWPRPPLP